MSGFTFGAFVSSVAKNGLSESVLLPAVLNMSITASVVIVFVLLARLLLKKAPKIFSYALWAVVLFRLLCPVSVAAGCSLLGLFDAPVTEATAHTSVVEYVPRDVVHTRVLEVQLPVPAVSQAVNEALPREHAALGADPMEGPMALALMVWIAGMCVMAIYSVASLLRLRRRLVGAVPLRYNIWLADGIDSPFVMGILRPKIYLPSSLPEREQGYILLHERHHIHRGDHIVKALAFLALCIHWFNPLVWLAFVLSARDMEMSCDEAVVKKLGEGIRADYSASLLSLATGRRIIAGTPLAFGEGDTRSRIRNLLSWKKPAFWAVLVSVTACAVLTVCLMTNPQVYQEAIQVNGRLYTQRGEAVSVLPEGSRALCALEGIAHQTKEPPAADFHAVNLDAKYAGSMLYQSGDAQNTIYLEDLKGFYIPFAAAEGEAQAENAAETPESGSAGAEPVLWTCSPMMSATWHAAFYFRFDLDYSHIEASCDNGMLWNPDGVGQPGEKALRFEAGQPVCWTPVMDGVALTDTAEAATVRFTVYDGGEVLFTGVLEITRTGTENGQSFYEARLGGTDLLALRQNPDNMGASLVLSDSAAIIAYTDLNHNLVNENIVVREVAPGMLYALTVEENGAELWSAEASPAHTGWNTIMLYSDGGGDYLVRYQPAMFQGMGSYTCTVFSLKGGQETVKEEWSVDFTLPVEETPEMARFAREVGVLLRNCTVLLSTEQGIVVDWPVSASSLPQLYPVRFDPEEIRAAIDGRADAPELTADAARFPDAPLEFLFASGAGGWGTELTLQPDGSFTGKYSDADMGVSSAEFPKGTCYVSEFSGRFTDIRQISDNAWSMKLSELATEKEPEETWIEGGVRYISAEPYGVTGGETFILYAPGTPADDIPADCRDWWPDIYRWRKGELEQLEGWGLCDADTGQGFFTACLS